MKIFSLIFSLITIFSSIGFAQQSSWQATFLGNPNHLTSISFPSESTGYIFGTEIMYKTTNSGSNWIGSLLPFKFYSSYFINTMTGYALAKSSLQSDTMVILKTTDGAVNWSNYRLSPRDWYRKVKFVNQNTGYIFSFREYYFRTTNGGLSWISKDVPNGYTIVDWDALDNTVWCAGKDDIGGGVSALKIYRSTNNGDNFTHIGGIPSNGQYYASYEIEMVNQDIGYLSYFHNTTGVEPNRVGKSTNGGANWLNVTFDNMKKLYFLNENTGFSFSYFTNGSTRINKTSNGGLNWTSDTVTDKARDMVFVNQLTGYCVCDYGVLLKTTNGGNPIGIQTISSEIPENFELSQNYPNPFNPSTTIRFSLPQSGQVKLVIYDISGKEIRNLVNQILSPGVYSYDFNADNLPSGMYIYRLSTKEFSDTKKMVVIK